MSKRELDLGRLLQKVGRRIEDEGLVTSQRLHDWKREAKMPQLPPPCATCDGTGKVDAFDGIALPCTFCGGTGDGPRPNGSGDGRQDQQASTLAAEWVRVRIHLEHYAERADWLMAQAKAADTGLRRDWTPAQAEAEGWCGAHWHAAKALVAITKRPSGEAYYKGRCRFCGSWPGGDPPAEVLRTRQKERAAS